MKWLLEKGREDPDACVVALTLSRALVEDQRNALKGMIKPVMRLLLGRFPGNFLADFWPSHLSPTLFELGV